MSYKNSNYRRGAENITTNSGDTAIVKSFSVDSFDFSGGSISISGSGVWYVGIDIFTNQLISLPRLGHMGWIPLARVVFDGTTITDIEQIAPELPENRIPNVTQKMLNGQSYKVLVMGSSLAEFSSSIRWAGMLSTGNESDYRLNGNFTLSNYAVGGVPNKYQLAQTGNFGAFYGSGFSNSGYDYSFNADKPPSGRPEFLADIDLVIITTLANGGDYRLESIGPIIRNLRKMNIEVLLTTDNALGYPLITRDVLDDKDLYKDGQTIFDIADYYSVQVADTAAYVGDAAIRHTGIYADFTHMTTGEPAGRDQVPASGHEVWARAIRSCIFTDASGVDVFENIKTKKVSKKRPVSPIVTDIKSIGDAFVILPQNEHYARTSNVSAGVLSANPRTTTGFPRKMFPSSVDPTKDLLTLTTGQKLSAGGVGVVGISLIIQSSAGVAAVGYDVKVNGSTIVKSATVPAQTQNRDILHDVLTPTEVNRSSVDVLNSMWDIEITSGEMRVTGICLWTFEMDRASSEEMSLVGDWTTNKVSGGSPGMQGYATDTIDDYAVIKSDEYTNRVAFAISGKPNSKPINTWSDGSSNLAEAAVGASNVNYKGHHIGRSTKHYIQCNETLVGGGDSTNGYALHVGGAYLVNDR